MTYSVKEIVQGYYDEWDDTTTFRYFRYEGKGSQIDALKWPLIRKHEWIETGEKLNRPLGCPTWENSTANNHNLNPRTFNKWS